MKFFRRTKTWLSTPTEFTLFLRFTDIVFFYISREPNRDNKINSLFKKIEKSTQSIKQGIIGVEA